MSLTVTTYRKIPQWHMKSTNHRLNSFFVIKEMMSLWGSSTTLTMARVFMNYLNSLPGLSCVPDPACKGLQSSPRAFLGMYSILTILRKYN